MFKHQSDHASVLNNRYRLNVINKNPKSIAKLKLRRNGASVYHHTKHLDRKVMHCFPRGKKWLRMIDILSVEYCESH